MLLRSHRAALVFFLIIALGLSTCAREPDVPTGYLGVWKLIPELSVYQAGEPLVSSYYIISMIDDFVDLDVSWSTSENPQPQFASYAGPCDGTRLKIDAAGIEYMAFDCISPSVLDSSGYTGDARVMYTRRVVSDDGQLLSVMQEAQGLDGAVVRNFQVFSRVR